MGEPVGTASRSPRLATSGPCLPAPCAGTSSDFGFLGLGLSGVAFLRVTVPSVIIPGVAALGVTVPRLGFLFGLSGLEL